MAVDRGVVLSGPGAVALEEIRVEPPGPGEVLVRIEATGVCHSDLHVIEEDGWGHALPVLLGHEGAGTVEAVGGGVDGLASGDRVVLGWKTACGHCPTCLRGEPRRCTRPPAAPGRLFRAGGGELTPVLRTGTFATHTVVPVASAVKVPRELPVEQACLIGCAVATGVLSVLETAARLGGRAGRRDRVRRRRSVGDPGRAHRRRGRDPRDRSRRAKARAGAAVRRHAHRARRESTSCSTSSGAAPRSSRRSAMIATGGTVVLIGLSPARETVEVELPALFGRRARILVSHGGDHLPQEDFPRLAQWALEGKLDLAGMVTRTAPLDDWQDALDAMQSGDVIRTVLTP